MSHFLCLVAGADPDYELAPFHEFECSGLDDEFVASLDKTAEYREEYEKATTRRLKAPDGTLHEPWDDKFYRDPTPDERPKVGWGTGCGSGISWASKDWGDGMGYRAKIKFIPDGYVEVEPPASEVQTFAEWIESYYGHEITTESDLDISGEHKYGYTLVDGEGTVLKSVDRTNLNAKWDWYQIGGRYSDRLILKNGTVADSAKKGDVDWFAMERNAGSDASNRYLTARTVLDQHPAWESWKTIRERHKDDIDAAREAYRKQPAVAAYKDSWDGPDEFLCSHEEYIQRAVDAAYPGFALLKDRTWTEKGSMGWWGIVSNEGDAASWNKAKREFIQSLPDDMLVTVVDCHI